MQLRRELAASRALRGGLAESPHRGVHGVAALMYAESLLRGRRPETHRQLWALQGALRCAATSDYEAQVKTSGGAAGLFYAVRATLLAAHTHVARWYAGASGAPSSEAPAGSAAAGVTLWHRKGGSGSGSFSVFFPDSPRLRSVHGDRDAFEKAAWAALCDACGV